MGDRARQREFWLIIAAVPATALVSLAMVVSATTAAGVPTVGDGGRLSEIRLAGRDRDVTAIDVPAMLPGDVAARCFAVSAVSDPTTSGLRVYGSASGPLTPYLHLSIMHGPDGASCEGQDPLVHVFDGPLADFGADYATGSGAHHRAAVGATVPYLVEVTLDEEAPDSAQGAAAHVELTWEVSATPS